MLPTHQRLRDNGDFRRIYARGRSYAHSLAVLYVYRRAGAVAQAMPGLRIGFVVSKKQGKATARNRIKRRLREAVRQQWRALPQRPFDLIFVARGRLRKAEWPEVRATVETLLRQAGLLALRAGPGAERSGEEDTGVRGG